MMKDTNPTTPAPAPENTVEENTIPQSLIRWQHLLESKVQAIDLRLTAVMEEMKDIRAEANLDRRCWMRDGNRLTQLEDEVRGDTICHERRYGEPLHSYQKGLIDKLEDLTDVVEDLREELSDLRDEVHDNENERTD